MDLYGALFSLPRLTGINVFLECSEGMSHTYRDGISGQFMVFPGYDE
jgi:hypothetical protein